MIVRGYRGHGRSIFSKRVRKFGLSQIQEIEDLDGLGTQSTKIGSDQLGGGGREIGFLGSGTGASKVPIPLREAEINRLFGKFDEANSGEEEMMSPFVVGEDVKVMDGPFSGFTGSIAQVFEDRKKVNVTVKIFGRNTPAELNYYQVEKSS